MWEKFVESVAMVAAIVAVLMMYTLVLCAATVPFIIAAKWIGLWMH